MLQYRDALHNTASVGSRGWRHIPRIQGEQPYTKIIKYNAIVTDAARKERVPLVKVRKQGLVANSDNNAYIITDRMETVIGFVSLSQLPFIINV